MGTLADRTVGELAKAAAARFSAPELRNLILTAEVEEYAPYDDGQQAYVKLDLIQPRLRGAQKAARQGNRRAHRALLDVVRLLCESMRDPGQPPDWFSPLREALLADGYQLVWTKTEEPAPPRDFLPPTTRTRVTWQVLPTDAGPVPLGAEISALEQELNARGYGVALNHYRQAMTAFQQHDNEAANGQLRTALEDLVVQLAAEHTGYVKPAKQGGGGPAIEKLRATQDLAAGDGGDLLKGLWGMTHTKGSHPGTSDAEETRFRVQVVTATARLLLHRFP